MAACQAGHASCCEMLIEHGASVDHATRDGVTALIVACSQGYVEVCKILSFKGASRNVTRSGLTPVDVSTHFGHDEVASFMKLSADWATPLHHLALLRPENVKRLLRQGADIDARARPDAISPVEIAHQLANGHCAAPGSSARLVLDASEPWSPATHSVWPDAQRARAYELFVLGRQLTRESRFTFESGALLDCWIGYVIPHALDRPAPPASACDLTCDLTCEEPAASKAGGAAAAALTELAGPSGVHAGGASSSSH